MQPTSSTMAILKALAMKAAVGLAFSGLGFIGGRIAYAAQVAKAREAEDLARAKYEQFWVEKGRDHVIYHFAEHDLDGQPSVVHFADRVIGEAPVGYEIEALTRMNDGQLFIVWKRAVTEEEGGEATEEPTTGTERDMHVP